MGLIRIFSLEKPSVAAPVWVQLACGGVSRLG